MRTFYACAVLLGSLSAHVAAKTSSLDFPEGDDWDRELKCRDDCLKKAIPTCSAAGCACWEQDEREAYFCCVGKTCGSDAMIRLIENEAPICEIFETPFTFDAEAVCDVASAAAPTSAPSSTSLAPQTTSGPSTTNQASTTAPPQSSTTQAGGSQSTSTGPSPTPTDSGAVQARLSVGGVVLLFAASAMLLW